MCFEMFSSKKKKNHKVNIGAERGKSNSKWVGGDQKVGRKGEGPAPGFLPHVPTTQNWETKATPVGCLLKFRKKKKKKEEEKE